MLSSMAAEDIAVAAAHGPSRKIADRGGVFVRHCDSRRGTLARAARLQNPGRFAAVLASGDSSYALQTRI